MRAEPKPENAIPWIDSREQLPWSFPNLGTPVVGCLNYGDYSYLGGQAIFRLERKSPDDFLGSIFSERFAKEMEGIRAFQTHALIVEADWDWLERGEWRIKATASQVVGKTLGLIESGINVILAGDRERAQRLAERLIFLSFRRRWRELRAILSNAESAQEASA